MDEQADNLGQIDRRPAAERDQAVAVVRAEKLERLHRGRFGWIGFDRVERGGRRNREPVDQAGLDDAPISDKHRPAHGEFFQQLRHEGTAPWSK